MVPNGYNRRVLMEMNLRSALHLVTLRGAANAHFSMRRAAQRIAERDSRRLAPAGQIHPDRHARDLAVDGSAYFAGTAEMPVG